MNDVTQTQLAAAIRQIVLVLGGFAVGKGWLEDDTVTAIATIAVILVPLVWGQLSTRKLAKGE